MADFKSITSINSFLSNIQLQQSWQLKSKNPGLASTSQSGLFSPLTPEQQAKKDVSDKTSSLLTKLQAGEDLSAAELEYLRQNAPEAYEDARRVLAERVAFRKALEKCETKEDVRNLHTAKVAEVLTAMRGGACTPEMAAAKLNGIAHVFGRFLQTSKYGALTDTRADFEDARATQREAVQGPDDADAPEAVEKQEEKEPSIPAECQLESTPQIPAQTQTPSLSRPPNQAGGQAYEPLASPNTAPPAPAFYFSPVENTGKLDKKA